MGQQIRNAEVSVSPPAESLNEAFNWRQQFGSLTKQLLRVLLIGAVAGPAIGLTLQFFARGSLLGVDSSMVIERSLRVYLVFGVLMSFSAFITCGLPSRYFQPMLRQYPRAVYRPLRILMIVAGALLALEISSYMVWRLMGVRIISKENLWGAFAISAGLTIVLAVVIGRLAKLSAEIRQTERLLYESKLKEQMLSERTTAAQLRALQAQINPHFFFNTLSSVAALINSDTAAAKEILVALADMYRYTLHCTNSRLVPLEDEMDFVRSYLGIEEVRFRDRLKVEIHSPESLSGMMIPGLVLQPLVENAVKHGIAHNIGSGQILINIDNEDQSFQITVSNTAEYQPNLEPSRWFVEGHALKNVDDRLQAIYGSDYKFDFNFIDGKVCVRIKLPKVQKIDYANSGSRR